MKKEFFFILTVLLGTNVSFGSLNSVFPSGFEPAIGATYEVEVTNTDLTDFGINFTNYNLGMGLPNPNSINWIEQASGDFFVRAADGSATGDSSGIASSTFRFFFRDNLDAANNIYHNGAQAGDDNWVFLRSIAGNKTWAQFNISEGAASIVRYVYDPAAPAADITLADAVVAPVPEPAHFAFALGAIFGLAALTRRRRAF